MEKERDLVLDLFELTEEEKDAIMEERRKPNYEPEEDAIVKMVWQVHQLTTDVNLVFFDSMIEEEPNRKKIKALTEEQKRLLLLIASHCESIQKLIKDLVK